MSAPALIDLRQLPVAPLGRGNPVWWGMIGLITIEAAVFATLITSYFYLRLGHAEWPPGGLEPPDLLWPTINTFVLLASSIPMHYADRGIARNDQRALKLGLLVSLILALTFLGIKAYELSHKEYGWDSHAYGSIVWTIIGFHTAHVVALSLKTLVVGLLAIKGFFHAEERIAVQVNGVYWHFVVAVWVPLYIVLYWVPRWT